MSTLTDRHDETFSVFSWKQDLTFTPIAWIERPPWGQLLGGSMKPTRLGAALIIVLAIGIVAAVTIYSVTLTRTQEIYGSGHEISIDPEPDLISSCGSANLIITESDTTTSPWTTGPCTCTWIRVDAISPDGSRERTFTLDYEGFVGTASYDVRAEGTT